MIGAVVAVIAAYTGGLALMSMTGASSAIAAAKIATLSQLMTAGAISGFAAGTSSGLLSGADLGTSLQMGLQGALIGAVSAGIANGIGTLGGKIASAWGPKVARVGKALLHGLTRAAISRVQGGRYSRHRRHRGLW